MSLLSLKFSYDFADGPPLSPFSLIFETNELPMNVRRLGHAFAGGSEGSLGDPGEWFGRLERG